MSLSRKVVAFQGKTPWGQQIAHDYATKAGAAIAQRVTRKVDYLVLGEGAKVSQAAKAHSLGVHTLTPPQFLAAATTTAPRPPMRGSERAA